MNNKIKTLLAAGAFMVGVQQAQAITYRDIELGSAGLLTAPGSSVSGQFNIVSGSDSITINKSPLYVDSGVTYNDIDGFTPGVDTATSAFAYFYVRDNNDVGSEATTIKLDLTTVVSGGVVGNGGVSIFVVDAFTVLASLNTDGLLDYTVTADTGDFFFDYARLDVQAVPDGGATAMLLGLGFLGAAGLRRKLS